MDDPHSSSLKAPSQGAEPPWDVLAERIDAFAAAWDQAEAAGQSPPQLDRYADGLDPSTARLVLLELVKLDIERRWQQQRDPRHIEWYVQELPRLGAMAHLPVDLLYEELQARMGAGMPVYQEEVRQRFPAQAESLLRLMGGLAVSGSPTAKYYAETADTVIDRSPAPGPTPARAPFAELAPGDKLDDFQLLSPLGSGAFARVFLARQISMERLVALKISAHTGSEPQTLAQLDHPSIVRVFDQRTCAQPPARLLYMEVVSGGTLQDAIARARNAYDGQASGLLLLKTIDQRLAAAGTPIPETSAARDWIADASWPEVVARIGAELADGLAYAHARGVLHRDIKPANVLLSAEGRPKLADFNVSYNGGRADENPEDAFGGSLAYMSPEQLEACHPLLGGSPRSVRETSDVYAVGVLLWELLAGRRPFRDEPLPPEGKGSLVRLQRMIDSRLQANFKRLAEQLSEDCPQSLREVLIKCLQPAKADRFQSAAELARSLRMCLNPRAWRLLQQPQGALGRFVLRRPVVSIVIAGLVPNLMTAAFNFQYNEKRIKGEWPQLWEVFWKVQWWINGIAFPVGVALGVWMALRVYRLIRSNLPAEALEGSRQVLLFGRFVSLMLLALWIPAGLAFPVAIGWGQFDQLTPGFFLHFFLSLALCGCAATAYPYFLITAMATHYFLPGLIRSGAIAGPRRRGLADARWLNGIHFAAASAVPLLGVLLIALVLVFADSQQKWPLLVVSAGGLAWLGAVMWLRRTIELDIDALSQLAVEEPRPNRGQHSSRGGSGLGLGSGRP
ncbi:MAG: protein kinase [Pirellulales bacterium]|nr:protein kinase [Pirellulales bacterium]